jgi:serine protease Do|nr:trypsin-like peptidase domain-containing protein [Candidatus Acidoferrales bacterium]
MRDRSHLISKTLSVTIRVSLLGSLILLGRPALLSAQSKPSTDPLHQLNSSVETLIKKISPSVVQIAVTGYSTVEENSRGSADITVGRQRVIGSGFVVDATGFIITNAHVVNGAEHILVNLPATTTDSTPSSSLASRANVVPGHVVGTAPELDLAVIKLDGPAKLVALPLAHYSELVQGQLVFAFGSPQGLPNSVTMGIVSATARQTNPDSLMAYIQTDAPINPGNSGGPLVNVDGEVVGVNTFILTQGGGNEGLNFAIPSAIVRLAFQQIQQYGHVHRGEIGISVQSISPQLATALKLPQNSGVIVSDVAPGSSALASGIKIQDIIASVDGKPVTSVPYFGFQMMTHGPGDSVHMEILRGTTGLVFDIPVKQSPHQIDQLASLADPQKSLVRPLGILGIEISPALAAEITDLRDPYGILVAARSAGSTSEVPLVTGDVIRTLDGVPMKTLDQLRAALSAIKPGVPSAFQIQRDGGLLYITFTLDQL